MNNNYIIIAVGAHANSLNWRNQKTTWEQFAIKLAKTTRTSETLAEYKLMSKKEKARVKDVGGYVGGHVKTGKRRLANIAFRTLLTLDLDYADASFWDDFVFTLDQNAAVLHATHTHTPEAPRYRLIMPLSRQCSVDEYEAVARKVAGILGIDQFDPSTFEPQRLMYWPSTCADLEYYYQRQDGQALDVDAMLAQYVDWRDVSEWPTNDRQERKLRSEIKKLGDPTAKKGLVGIFCRRYDVHDAILTFLGDCYEQVNGTRYTYAHGTTAGGLVVYDDTFAYSHHATDPCAGRLVNAYDLVRLNKFAHLDEGEEKETASNAAMIQFVNDLDDIAQALYEERVVQARDEFESIDDEEEADEEDMSWAKELEVLKSGEYASTAKNISIILKNDKRLKGAFAYNDFDGRRYLVHSVPWRKVKGRELCKDVDYSGVRAYIETVYNIVSSGKIEDGLALAFNAQAFHPVREYLDALEWDGTPRVDTLLIEYFGADDNAYTREAIRKMMVGAVARIYRPGVKFDLVLTLVGEQGEGKSRFFDLLGRQWFSDTFSTVSGKESFEQIQGAWIIEMAELSGLKKAEIEAVKHFLTKREDRYRPAYMRTVETYLRQCIFVATTNSRDFLRDPSGNRRFMPIDVIMPRAVESVHSDAFANSIDQLWAEAKHYYESGELLYLSPEAERIANEERVLHTETDERRGLIDHYLDTILPESWESLDLYSRRAYLDGNYEGKGTRRRLAVCIAEIWCECLGREKEDMSRYNTQEINNIMRSMQGWAYVKTPKNFKGYGKQKYYIRKETGEMLE